MSDQRLRDLERRWKESGAVQDEAEFLVGRIRSGDLDPERVRLAAALRHPAAGIAASDSGGPPGAILANEADLVSALRPTGREGHVRVGLAVGWLVLPLFENRYPQREGGRAPLFAAEEWVLRPSDETHLAARKSTMAPIQLMGDPEVTDEDALRALDAVTLGAEAVFEQVPFHPDFAAELEVLPCSWEDALKAIRDELCPWLLVNCDPVRRRVKERRREGE